MSNLLARHASGLPFSIMTACLNHHTFITSDRPGYALDDYFETVSENGIEPAMVFCVVIWECRLHNANLVLRAALAFSLQYQKRNQLERTNVSCQMNYI